jgi:hypothetical protein
MRGRWHFLGGQPAGLAAAQNNLSSFRRFLIANGITGKRLAHGPLFMALQAGAFPVTSLHVEKGDAYRTLINSS